MTNSTISPLLSKEERKANSSFLTIQVITLMIFTYLGIIAFSRIGEIINTPNIAICTIAAVIFGIVFLAIFIYTFKIHRRSLNVPLAGKDISTKKNKYLLLVVTAAGIVLLALFLWNYVWLV